MKTCTGCKETKDESEFYSSKKGLRAVCKTCHNADCKEWQRLNRKTEGYRLRSWDKRRRSTWEGRLCSLVKSAKQRSARGLEFALGPEWLKSCSRRLLDNPTCELTGVEIILTTSRYRNGAHPCAPSLDRKDPRRGYTPDNVRVVASWVNMAKGALSDATFKEWCKAVVEADSYAH